MKVEISFEMKRKHLTVNTSMSELLFLFVI